MRDLCVSSGYTGVNNIDEALHALITRGFRFRHVTDAAGELVAVVGSFPWSRFVDRVHLYDEDSAIAARVVSALPHAVVWSYTGTALSTMVALLELPGPYEPHAPRTMKPAPSGLWLPGHRRWW